MAFDWDTDAVERHFGEPERFWTEDREFVTDVVYRRTVGRLQLELAFDCCDVSLRLTPLGPTGGTFRIDLWRAKRLEYVEDGDRAWFDFPRAALELPISGPPDAQAAVRLHVKPTLMLEVR